MKNIIKQLIKVFLKIIPLPIFSRIIQPKVTGLIYHAVSDHPLPHVDYIYPSVSTTRFEGALIYLKRNFNLITYEQLHVHIIDGVGLPRRAAHLSFDDGYVECYTLVRPLLLKYEIPCTFFITTDLIDNQNMFFRNKVGLCIERVGKGEETEVTRYLSEIQRTFDTKLKGFDDFSQWIKAMTQGDTAKIDEICDLIGVNWKKQLKENPFYLSSDQIKQMADEGFTIGSHTRSHPKLVQVSEKEMEAEIVESSKIIQAITGDEVIPFAFPNTATGIDRQVLAGIRKRHPFLGLFFDAKGFREDIPFIVNRIWAEKPEFADKGAKTNLPYVLKDAYREFALEKILGLARK